MKNTRVTVLGACYSRTWSHSTVRSFLIFLAALGMNAKPSVAASRWAEFVFVIKKICVFDKGHLFGVKNVNVSTVVIYFHKH